MHLSADHACTCPLCVLQRTMLAAATEVRALLLARLSTLQAATCSRRCGCVEACCSCCPTRCWLRKPSPCCCRCVRPAGYDYGSAGYGGSYGGGYEDRSVSTTLRSCWLLCQRVLAVPSACCPVELSCSSWTMHRTVMLLPLHCDALAKSPCLTAPPPGSALLQGLWCRPQGWWRRPPRRAGAL